MPSDLVAWLQDQLDAELRDASAEHERGCSALRLRNSDTEAVLTDPTLCSCRVRHRLLDIDARRRVLDDYEDAVQPITEPWQWQTVEGGYAAGLEHAVRDLALAYAERRGYRDEWRP